uniref:SWIRM domain protein n=1 Tax=Hirondellea gigas TaxID=1518452 RepID=A0A6A7FV35_9CRUS
MALFADHFTGGRRSSKRRKAIDFTSLANSGQQSYEDWDANVTLEDARKNFKLANEFEAVLSSRKVSSRPPDVPLTKEQQAVVNAGLLLSEATDLERKVLPQFIQSDKPRSISEYFTIRDHILLKWDSNPTRFLTIDAALDGIDTDSLQSNCVDRIYDFLYQYGFINSGILAHGDSAHPTFGPGTRKRIIIIGAGASGLSAARQLQGFGHSVLVLEARRRIGGRVKTRTAMIGGAVDVGASIITGLTGNPISLLCRQLYSAQSLTGNSDSKIYVINPSCPIYDSNGSKIARAIDKKIERLWNLILDGVHRLRRRLFKETDSNSESKNPSPGFPEPLPLSTTSTSKPSQPLAQPSPSSADSKTTMDIDTDDDISTAFEPQNTNFDDNTPNQSCSTSAPSVSGAADPGGGQGGVHEKPSKQEAVPNLEDVSPHATSSQGEKRWSSAELDSMFGAILSEGELLKMSLLEGINFVKSHLKIELSQAEEELYNWHIANLEYGCAQSLSNVSLVHWDQDDPYEFTGHHCMLRDGYGPLIDALAADLDIETSSIVEKVEYSRDGHCEVFVKGANDFYLADAVICTIPLGVLKRDMIEFDPVLPKWKLDAIRRLGAGNLNKILMEFSSVFWDQTSDMFGKLSSKQSGRSFLFWNISKLLDRPILVALVSGDASYDVESIPKEKLIEEVMADLRRIFGADVPDPIASRCSRWDRDRFSRGSYSFIPVGSTGDDYDILARSVDDKIFFAGEATFRKHPATVAGAYLSGLQCAAEIEALGKTFPSKDSEMDDVPAAHEIMPAMHQTSGLSVKNLSSCGSLQDVTEDEMEDEDEETVNDSRRKRPSSIFSPKESPKRRRVEVNGEVAPIVPTSIVLDDLDFKKSSDSNKDSTPIMNGAALSASMPFTASMDRSNDLSASTENRLLNGSIVNNAEEKESDQEPFQLAKPIPVRRILSVDELETPRQFYERPKKLPEDRRFIVNFNRRQRFKHRGTSHVSIALGVKMHRDWLEKKRHQVASQRNRVVELPTKPQSADSFSVIKTDASSSSSSSSSSSTLSSVSSSSEFSSTITPRDTAPLSNPSSSTPVGKYRWKALYNNFTPHLRTVSKVTPTQDALVGPSARISRMQVHFTD